MPPPPDVAAAYRLARVLGAGDATARVAAVQAAGSLPALLRTLRSTTLDGPLAGLGPLDVQQRALLVLPVWGAGAEETAAAAGVPRRALAVHTREAIGATGRDVDDVEQIVLRALADPLEVPADLLPEADRATSRRRGRARRRRLLAALALALALGAVAGVHGWRDAVAPTRVEVAVGLLDWPTRGSLASDADFAAKAQRLWNAEQPVTAVHPLYLGRLALGRVAVLEGLVADRPTLAVLADYGAAGRQALMLAATGPIIEPSLPVVAVVYAEASALAGVAPPAAYVQVLASPRLTRLERRTSTGWEVVRLGPDGRSRSWFSVPAGATRGVLRATAGGATRLYVVPLSSPAPEEVTVARVGPPWPRLRSRVPAAVRTAPHTAKRPRR